MDPSFSHLIFSAIEYNFFEILPCGSFNFKISKLLNLNFNASESAKALILV